MDGGEGANGAPSGTGRAGAGEYEGGERGGGGGDPAGVTQGRPSPRRKVVLTIVDGLGDTDLEWEDGGAVTTPLGRARTPVLDAAARIGLTGLVDPVAPGVACGSDTAHLSLLGVDPRRFYAGRGAFEALGAGLDVRPGDVAFKANLGTLEAGAAGGAGTAPAGGGTEGAAPVTRSGRPARPGSPLARPAVRLRCAGSDLGLPEAGGASGGRPLGAVLAEALDGLSIPGYPEHTLRVLHAGGHRCCVALRGPGLSGAITGTDPLRDGLPLARSEPLNESAEAVRTAALVEATSEATQRMLEAHPANARRTAHGLPAASCLLLRGPQGAPALPSFRSSHGGARLSAVAPAKIVRGVVLALGGTEAHDRSATGDAASDLASKVASVAAAAAADEADVFLLHVKAGDDAGHDGDAVRKRDVLENVDRALAQLVVRLVGAGLGDSALAFTGDHSTPVALGDHSCEPVPFLLCRIDELARELGGEAWARGVPMGPVIAGEPAPHPASQPGGRAAADRAAPTPADDRPGGSEGAGEASGRSPEGHLPPPTPASPAVPPRSPGATFSEASAASGSLGRFPGLQVMPLLEAFCGWER